MPFEGRTRCEWLDPETGQAYKLLVVDGLRAFLAVRRSITKWESETGPARVFAQWEHQSLALSYFRPLRPESSWEVVLKQQRPWTTARSVDDPTVHYIRLAPTRFVRDLWNETSKFPGALRERLPNTRAGWQLSTRHEQGHLVLAGWSELYHSASKSSKSAATLDGEELATTAWPLSSISFEAFRRVGDFVIPTSMQKRARGEVVAEAEVDAESLRNCGRDDRRFAFAVPAA